ncbi:exodeoxyribonuclease V subunit gamma, partial [Thiocapsa sp.]|uniref:exodeoxyribonuclease V subunit gamma n=1 Tax=Thiocapsa sp. TaxID=2024551 RepID=UPI0035939115
MELDVTVSALTPGLMLVHGNRPEDLRDLLVEWMARYPLAPLENEIVLVQSNGIAQWLKLALAADADPGAGDGVAGERGLGIAAALEISLPARFLWRVYRAVLGADAVPEVSPFDKSRLVWRLMRLLPELLARPEYLPLRRFLQDDADLRKRFQLAERLADLYDQYQVYRADWLAAWAEGEDVLIESRGGRIPLPDEQRWQSGLWRALLADVKAVSEDAKTGGAGRREQGAGIGRAGVHEAFLRRVSDWPEDAYPLGLPRRVMVFGISSLPRQSLEVLAGMARWTQVLMCVHNPCEHYWADIVADKDLLRAERSRQRRRDGMSANLSEEEMHLHAHPLLAAWGKQGRDFIGLLDEHDDEAARAGYSGRFDAIGQRIDLFDASQEAGSVLAQLQDDIRDLRPLNDTCTHWPEVSATGDASIRFHIAHSPQREVEILHDVLLAAFNADATLTPRDIIVMVPDIDTYAPHIQAVFGLIDREDPRYIPYSVADQGQRATEPLIAALEKLLELPRSRLAVSDVLDLLEAPAVRRRFGVAEADLPRLHRWIRGANIRWGLHAEQRASLDLPTQADAQAQHTWLFGLRRMLL